MKHYRVWHKKRNRSYAWANSPAGRRYAKRHRCNAADRDWVLTLDKVPVVTHEGVGVHEFANDPRPRSMKWERVRKLRRHGRFGRRIRTATSELRAGVKSGVTPFFDIKGGDKRTQNPDTYKPIIRLAKLLRVRVHFMSDPFDGKGIASLSAARQAAAELGDPKLVHLTILYRGRMEDDWWDIVDDVKGYHGPRPEGKPGRVTGRLA